MEKVAAGGSADHQACPAGPFLSEVVAVVPWMVPDTRYRGVHREDVVLGAVRRAREAVGWMRGVLHVAEDPV